MNALPLCGSLAALYKRQVLIVGLTDGEIRVGVFSNGIDFIAIIGEKWT